MPKNDSSKPSHCRSHPSVTCSSSVAAGADLQSIAFTFTVAASRSARMDGGVDETEKYPKKRGWFQRVRAGKIAERKSAKMASIGSPVSGAERGSLARRSPG